jgi:hypothetical protein
MIQIMQEHRQTGLLHTNIPPRTTGVHETRRVEIFIESGAVKACVITSENGRKVEGEQAYQALVRLGRLRWTFTPQMQSSKPSWLVPSDAPITTSLPFPRRIVNVEQHQMRSWPRLYRLVFALADGTKSVEKIATMLSTTSGAIEPILRDLRKKQLIIIEQKDTSE